MIGPLRGGLAVAVLTMRELTRQRLWIVFAVLGLAFLVTLPLLRAVDDAARLKLAVLAISSTLGFVGVLMSILIGAQVLRRDLDTRTGYVLFSKPLRPITYLVGRWVGAQAWLLAGLAALGAIGVLAVAWRFDTAPVMRATQEPSSWTQISAIGETVEIASDRDRVSLSGLPGNGLALRPARRPARGRLRAPPAQPGHRGDAGPAHGRGPGRGPRPGRRSLGRPAPGSGLALRP